MVSHIVLFRPKSSLTNVERQTLIKSLRQAVDGIASIKRAVVGRRILLGRPGYETEMAEHYEYSAILEFDSEADLRAYLDHPAHAELGGLLFKSADAVLAYDFTNFAPAELSKLIG